MLRSIFALFFRSLRGDSRSLWVHASWLLLLLIIYAAMGYAQLESRFVGAPGLQFFQTVIFTDATFITLLGIGFFSSVISEEKEEDTLGLMMMAGISPLGILLGKSTTRLFQVFVLLAVQYPFTLLAITLGGLTPDQIYAAYVALLAYTILLANVGLFCSVACRRNRDASALTTLCVFAYIVVPMFAYGGYVYFMTGNGSKDPRWSVFKPILEQTYYSIYQSSVFFQLSAVTETGFRFTWTPQIITNSIGGIALFLLSWWLFGIVPHDFASESMVRVVAPRKSGKLRWFDTGRVWNHALVWKDFHFIAGGWVGALMRIGLYVGMYWLAFAAMFPWNHPPNSRQINWRDVTEGYQYFVVPLFVVDFALCMSRLFHEEIRYQTLASLLMLPRSVAHVVYSKLGGCLLGLVPGMIALIAAYFLLMDATKTLTQVIERPMTWLLVANLFLLVHLCAVFSAYLRWGSFTFSLILFGCSMILPQIVLITLRLSSESEQTLIKILIIPIVLATASCHLIVLLRLPALGEK